MAHIHVFPFPVVGQQSAAEQYLSQWMNKAGTAPLEWVCIPCQIVEVAEGNNDNNNKYLLTVFV